jgi:hypothetical protein
MTADHPDCRLCGLAIRQGDDAARLADEYFHTACAAPAFNDTPTWAHLKIGDLNNLAKGMGQAAGMYGP